MPTRDVIRRVVSNLLAIEEDTTLRDALALLERLENTAGWEAAQLPGLIEEIEELRLWRTNSDHGYFQVKNNLMALPPVPAPQLPEGF